MTLADSEPAVSPSPPHRRRGIGWWAERIVPRLAALVFLSAGFQKAYDPTKIQRVLAFDGIPGTFVPATALLVWAGEIAIGLCLLFGVARGRTITIAIFALLAFSLQLAYLIVAQNPPDCACFELLRKYQTAHQVLVTGLVRNALIAACLEWVRLRIVQRST